VGLNTLVSSNATVHPMLLFIQCYCSSNATVHRMSIDTYSTKVDMKSSAISQRLFSYAFLSLYTSLSLFLEEEYTCVKYIIIKNQMIGAFQL